MTALPPLALVAIVSVLVDRSKQLAHTPQTIEIRYGGRHALEAVGPELLRDLAQIRELQGLPVTFPEEPSDRPGLVEVTVQASRGAVSAGLAPEMLHAG